MNKAKIYYYDIGDYLNREEKLKIVKLFKSFSNLPVKGLVPNEQGDWISQRNDLFGSFISIVPDKKFNLKSNSFFVINSNGLQSNRDNWVYNYSNKSLLQNVQKHVSFYNTQVVDFKKARETNPKLTSEEFKNNDESRISWASSLVSNLERYSKAIFESDKICDSMYRPYTKQKLYFGDKMIHRGGQFKEFFPKNNKENFVICFGNTNAPSCLITSNYVDSNFSGYNQCFPLYYYEEQQKQNISIFDSGKEKEYIRRDGVSDFILERAKRQYGKNVTKEDIFYYVYGFLHSPEYREKFANDLKKMLPRLPLVEDVRDFWAFSKAGRKLAELHINYENIPPAPEAIVVYNTIQKNSINKALVTKELESINYRVEKMRYPQKGETDKIIYNSQITISDIPAKAYKYVINGKSAIDWIMERYQVMVHKESGIKNDPNDWATETGKPKYILDLLLSIINVSIQTVDIVEALPKLKFE